MWLDDNDDDDDDATVFTNEKKITHFVGTLSVRNGKLAVEKGWKFSCKSH